MDWFFTHAWIAFVFMGGYMVTVLMLICCESVRKSSPCNLIVFFVLVSMVRTPKYHVRIEELSTRQVECMSGVTMFLTAHYRTHIIFGAMAITAAVCLLATLVAIVIPVGTTASTLPCTL